MALLWLLLRVRWRRAWGPSVVVCLLIGAIGGFVLASAAAARRVDSAYRRLLDEIDAPDLAVVPACAAAVSGSGCSGPIPDSSGNGGTEPAVVVERLLAIDVIEKARPVRPLFPYFVNEDGTPLLGTPENTTGCGDYDGSVAILAAEAGSGRDQAVPTRVEGEVPVAGSSGVVLSRATAARAGIEVGQDVRLVGSCNSDGEIFELEAPIELRVSGLSVGPLDVEPPGAGFEIEPAYVDPVVFQALLGSDVEPDAQVFVWLDAEASPAQVAEGLRSYHIVLDLRDRTRSIDDALAADARLLWLLAAVGALGGVLVVAPVIGRVLRDTGPDPSALAAVGAQPSLIARQGISYTLSLAVIGSVSAAMVAVPLAALMPRGLAAAIAPNRELWFDGFVTGVGFVVLLTVVLGIGAIAASRIPSTARSKPARLSGRGGGPAWWIRLRPAGQTGVLAAVGTPAGPRRASPWPSLVSMVVVATAGVASVTYLAGLRHLERTPRVVGWNWDASIFFQYGSGDPEDLPEVIARLAGIGGVEQVTFGVAYPPAFLVVPDTEISFIWPWAFSTGPDAITPTMLSGRAPTGPDEVAVDQVLAEQADVGVGDIVSFGRKPLVSSLDDELRQAEDSGVEGLDFAEYDDRLVIAVFEITGIAILPLERSQEIPQAAFTLEGYADLVEPTAEEVTVARAALPEDLPSETEGEVERTIAGLQSIDELPTAMYLRFFGDANSITEAVRAVDGVPEVVAPTPEQVLDLVVKLNVERNDRGPIALAAMVAALFAALASYLLFASVRARRFEMAVLRALGMSTSGIRRSVSVQATATALVALLVAIPVGVVIGRWAWLEYARDLKVLPVSVIPWPTLAVVAVAAVAVANVAALSLGWTATNRSPGPDLSSQ